MSWRTSKKKQNDTIFVEKYSTIKKDIIRNRQIYLMLIPVIIYFLLFHYQPMYGAQIAFKQFSPGLGIWGSPWVGLRHYEQFFQSYYFYRLVRNTVLINVYDVIFGFPIPIILALLLNEVRSSTFKRSVQTVTYLPHFISIVVVCGIIIDFTSRNGLINDVLEIIGFERISFLMRPEWFRFIFVGSGIWQSFGWGSIIYLAAMSNIDPQLYEASTIDGASRWMQVWNITVPGIKPTIVILFILRLGQMMSVGAEKILLLYNPGTYETGDVISTFVYRVGLLQMNYSYSSAVGLFNSVINFSLLIAVNRFCRKFAETSLW